jgi:hypothetical protein
MSTKRAFCIAAIISSIFWSSLIKFDQIEARFVKPGGLIVTRSGRRQEQAVRQAAIFREADMTAESKGATALDHDERIYRMSSLRQKMIRPELGAIGGTIAVFLFFAVFAPNSGMFSLEGVMNWGIVSAQFAIIAVGACLLMIAGEFDLSVGSMIGFSGIVMALLSTSLG